MEDLGYEENGLEGSAHGRGPARATMEGFVTNVVVARLLHVLGSSSRRER